jgi:2-succinyl-5-enolpyruvyl-6-hydroxy-3-cyclohexene-1-carboxylate synthase
LEGKKFYGNRGVSGIEGHVAATMGLVDGLNEPAMAFMGDVTAIHDLNSFVMLGHTRNPVCVVVFNDRSGGIFRRIDGQGDARIASSLILTPHEFEFSGIAKMAGLDYERVTKRREFKDIYERFWANPKPLVVECFIDAALEDEAWKALAKD